MKSLAIMNQKGGSGKTTTAVNLAAALGERGRRTLVVDLDPQASASSWLGVRDAGRGLLDFFLGTRPLADLVQETSAPGVAVVPSSAWLVGLERVLAREDDAETRLQEGLRKLPRDRWEFLLVDCPPALGTLTVNALAAVQGVLVPVEAHVLALEGLAQLLPTVEAVRERLNPELRVSGVLACRVDARTRHALEVVEQLRSKLGDLVFKTIIRENVRLAEAPSFGQPITLYDPRSAGAEDYRALAEELTKRKGKG